MKKEAYITISDTQVDENGNEEKIEISTRGYVMYGRGDMFTVGYDEQYDEFAGCHTVITVKNGSCASIVRRGKYNSEIIVEEGVHHSCQYNTPYGTFILGIYARQVSADITDGSGTLILDYSADCLGDTVSQTYMEIRIKTDK